MIEHEDIDGLDINGIDIPSPPMIKFILE